MKIDIILTVIGPDVLEDFEKEDNPELFMEKINDVRTKRLHENGTDRTDSENPEPDGT